MTWYRVLDSPFLPWGMATASVLLVGLGMLFAGINIGTARAPDAAKRRLGDAQRKIIQLTSALAQSQLALEHARDVKRSMLASARDLEATVAKHVNRSVEAVQASVKHLVGCSDQPRRTA